MKVTFWGVSEIHLFQLVPRAVAGSGMFWRLGIQLLHPSCIQQSRSLANLTSCSIDTRFWKALLRLRQLMLTFRPIHIHATAGGWPSLHIASARNKYLWMHLVPTCRARSPGDSEIAAALWCTYVHTLGRRGWGVGARFVCERDVYRVGCLKYAVTGAVPPYKHAVLLWRPVYLFFCSVF